LPDATPAGADFIPETVLWPIGNAVTSFYHDPAVASDAETHPADAAGHFARVQQSALQAPLTRGIFCNACD
jgi:hypothetical protein